MFTNALKSPLEAPRAVLRACLVSFPTYPLQKRVHVPESLLWRFCSSSSFSFLLLMPFPTVKTCRISPLNAVFPPRFFARVRREIFLIIFYYLSGRKKSPKSPQTRMIPGFFTVSFGTGYCEFWYCGKLFIVSYY